MHLLSPRNHESVEADFGPDATVEVMGWKVQLRDDIRWTPASALETPVQKNVCSSEYQWEDPLNETFGRCDGAYRRLAALLDGRRTVAEALAELLTDDPTIDIRGTEAASFVAYLIDSGLAVTHQSVSPGRITAADAKRSRSDRRQWTQPLFQKITLGHLGPFTDRFGGPLRVMASPIGILVGICCMAEALRLMIHRPGLLFRNPAEVISASNGIALVVSFLLLRFVHETGHVACLLARGGRPGRGGLLLALFVPMPFVDVSTAWRLRRLRDRCWVSAGGMLAEAWAASIAIIALAHTRDPWWQSSLTNFVWAGLVTTVLFNLNPLMRFDGYHLLADVLRRPNLATDANAWLVRTRARWLWGDGRVEEPAANDRPFLVAAYALAAAAWRVIVYVGLIVVAETMFFGAGCLLSILALATWLVVPTIREALRRRPLGTFRLGYILSWVGLSAIAVAAMASIPMRERIRAFAVITHSDTRVVRSATSGFLLETSVREGSRVRRGDVLAVLSSPELSLRRTHVSLELEKAAARWRAVRAAEDGVEIQIAEERWRTLQTQLSETNALHDALIIRSPCDGIVCKCELDDVIGTHVDKGVAMVSIGSDGPLQIRGMVAEGLRSDRRSAEADKLELRSRAGQTVQLFPPIQMPTKPVSSATSASTREPVVAAENIDAASANDDFRWTRWVWLPRMTRQPLDPALAAAVGGPLDAVMDRDGPEPTWQLTASMRPFRITLDDRLRPRNPTDRERSVGGGSRLPFAPGQVVSVRWTGDRRTLGNVAFTRLWDWWTNRHSLNQPTAVATRGPNNRHR